MKRETIQKSTKPKERTIYDLDLHDFLIVRNTYFVLRVPGGWLYDSDFGAESRAVFVPFNDEFM